MLQLHNLTPAGKKRKRVGRGGSRGGTSGRGHKGQKARSGSHTPRAGFEGGQMPLYRRLPKRGFNNADHTTYYIPVNISSLESFEAGSVVDVETLRKAGLAQGSGQGVKILGNGELSKKLTLKVQAFSASAKQKIESAGGTCEAVALIPKTGKRAL
mgnify:CR=1 FL=1